MERRTSMNSQLEMVIGRVRMSKRLALVSCLAALLFLGCTAVSTYVIRIRATSTRALPVGLKYVLLPGNKGGYADQEFEEYAGYVRKVLTELLYTEAETPDSADNIILLSYGLGTPSINADPLVRPALYETSKATKIISAVAYGLDSAGGRSDSGLAPLIIPVAHPRTRFFSLEAMDAKTSEKVTLWKVVAISRGYSADLRKVVPAMLAACKPFIGRTSTREEVVQMREDDEQVRVITEY
jgi:hypothetical protein